jgi:hypothetical protein
MERGVGGRKERTHACTLCRTEQMRNAVGSYYACMMGNGPLIMVDARHGTADSSIADDGSQNQSVNSNMKPQSNTWTIVPLDRTLGTSVEAGVT